MPKSKKGKRSIETEKHNNTYKGNNGKTRVESNGRRSTKKRKDHTKLKTALKIILIMFLLLCVIGAGVVAGVFFGVFGNDFTITKDELIAKTENTIVVDSNENEIANLSQDEKRKSIKLDEMSEYLPNAYVAIEDKRFYKHNGVDLKRTAGAILGVVTKNSSYGGSSITQQLVKNITNEKARSGVAGVARKVKEWSKAIQVERMISKDQILELYLNIIFVGGDNLHGVELASIYYFNKNAKDLDLAECAYIAGINNSPNAYSPYNSETDNSEKIKTRTLTVLSEMKTQGYIKNDDDYNTAVAKVEAGLTFSKGDTSSNSQYSYHTDAAIDQVVEQVMGEKGVTREFAEKYVYSSGLKIYSTQDTEVQKRVEEEFNKSKYIVSGKEKDSNKNLLNEHTQAGLVIIDNKTGYVTAVGGELGATNATGWNRGTQMIRQTGSSMKPIADIVPGLEEKVITASTVYDDVKTDFSGYQPENYNYFRGLINIRSFIETSQNIPAVKIMRELTPKKSIEYLKKMGITTLDDKKDDSLSLAIGGLTNGISPLEMAAAYATISNDGVYRTPLFYTKVVDSSGNVVLTPTQEKTRVMSEQNAYITRSIIEEPVIGSSGTAKYCAITGMETCAKTGTTDDQYDRWLCGMTPYYTTACWFGYDTNEKVTYSSGNPAGLIWSAIMKDIHTNLENANFNKPSGIVEAKVCKTTGCLATSSCTDTYTEIFTEDNMPEKCEGHGVQTLCTESGKVATEYCPQTKKSSYGGVIPKEQLNLWKAVNGSNSKGKSKIEETCTLHTTPIRTEVENTTTTTNTTTTNTTANTSTDNTTSSGGETPPTNTTQTNETH